MQTNPNTNASALAGALGVLVTWLIGHFQVADLSAEDGATISTALAVIVLYIGREGLRGIFSGLWRGNKGTTSANPPPTP